MATELPPDGTEGRGRGDDQAEGGDGAVSDAVPRALAEIADQARSALEDPQELERLFNESVYPMLTVDGERRYVDVNRSARLLIRRTLEEMRRLRIDDLTPPEGTELLETAWHRLVTTGNVSGWFALAFPDGSRLELVYTAISYPLRARHLVIFTPASWSEHELAQSRSAGANLVMELTPRELEVLRLAAMGNSAPEMADRLVIAESTIKTHLANIYAKLGVSDRSAAVAKAIRTGLID
jgi:DNA-binding CsgD family transcriptional regulator